jgi:hypothetical protein
LRPRLPRKGARRSRKNIETGGGDGCTSVLPVHARTYQRSQRHFHRSPGPDVWNDSDGGGLRFYGSPSLPVCINKSASVHEAAVLMRGDGCSVVGNAVRDAVRIAVYLRANARLQTEGMRLGDVTFLSKGEIVATAEMSASSLAADRLREYWAGRSDPNNSLSPHDCPSTSIS